MLEYLVTSATRRRLLIALWRDRARGTASSLARRAGVPFGAAYQELKAMARAGAAREALESGRHVYEANADSPCAEALSQLVSVAAPVQTNAPEEESSTFANAVRRELAAHGAPLWDQPAAGEPAVPLEELLAHACELAHRDPSVAKVLPYMFVRKKDQLNHERFERALVERKQKHTGGFFLAVAGALAQDKTLTAWSKRLKDQRRKQRVDFFPEAVTSRLAALSGQATLPLARAWGYRLQLTIDDFRPAPTKLPAERASKRRTRKKER